MDMHGYQWHWVTSAADDLSSLCSELVKCCKTDQTVFHDANGPKEYSKTDTKTPHGISKRAYFLVTGKQKSKYWWNNVN